MSARPLLPPLAPLAPLPSTAPDCRPGRARARRALATAAALAAGLAGGLLLPGAAHAAEATCTVNGKAVTSEHIMGTDGDDVIECGQGVPAGAVIHAGAGNDTITVTGPRGRSGYSPEKGGSGNDGEVRGGPGDDTIKVTGGTGGDLRVPSLSHSHATVTADGGTGSTGTVLGGNGRDTITVTGGEHGNRSRPQFRFGQGGDAVHGDHSSVDGGAGDDSIRLDSPGGTGLVGGSKGFGATGGQMRGGPGDDAIEIEGFKATRSALVSGGEGEDVIALRGVNGLASRLDGGAGNDRITVHGRSYGNGYASEMLGGPGDDFLGASGQVAANDGRMDGGPGVNSCLLDGKNSGDIVNCPRHN
ncbi:hypothetical protein [Streptomyces sp. NPDC059009]|uniref:hypothetical protein n=1 Tax=Streptomyces sp. NPDC059009 TaxID=3346694 RepID=UPI0036BBF0C6